MINYKIFLIPILSGAFLEASGQATFIRTYDLPDSAMVTSIAPTDDGGMIVCGYVIGEGLLYRFDAIGNLNWSKRYYDEGGTVLFTEPHQVEFHDVESLNDGFFIVGRSEHAIVDTI